MNTTDMRALVSSRYTGDIQMLKAIRADQSLSDEHKRIAVLKEKSRTRLKLLASAIRVSDGLLPTVSASMSRIADHVDVGKPLEAFVFGEADINAFVTEGRASFLVGISSGAVSVLTPEELEFVIGHELGHALYGHTEVAAGFLCETGRVTENQGRLLRSWQRAAEISADRAGLLCCESLEVATTALVKTLAGLPFQGQRFHPDNMSDQWESLLEEVLDEGASDLWEHSHPFPPIRIQALGAFWKEHQGQTPGVGADDAVARLLGMMESHENRHSQSGAPQAGLLVRFLFWGGLFLGTADGPLDPAVKQRLDALTFPGVDLDALVASGQDLAGLALDGFRAARDSRRSKLRAAELTSLMKQLVAFAALDNHFSEHERARLVLLANELKLPERAVELLIEQYKEANS